MPNRTDWRRDPKLKIDVLCEVYGIPRTLTAIHECTHALVADAAGSLDIDLNLNPTEKIDGAELLGLATLRDCDEFVLRDYMAVDFAGRLGEIRAARFCPQIENDEGQHGSSYHDLESIATLTAKCEQAFGRARAEEIRREAFMWAHWIIRLNFDRVAIAAHELLRAKHLDGEATREALWMGLELGEKMKRIREFNEGEKMGGGK